MRSKRIIIVDDDADDREILRDAFMANDDSIDYTFAENGEVLLEQLNELGKDNLPCLVLLDLNMPNKDGREVLEEIKINKKFPALPVIVFTTSSSQRDKDVVYELGANCFVTKPDTFDKLVDLTKCLLNLWM